MGPIEVLEKIHGIGSTLGELALTCDSDRKYTEFLAVAAELAPSVDKTLFAIGVRREYLRELEVKAEAGTVQEYALTCLRIMAHHREMNYTQMGAWGLGFAASRFEEKAKVKEKN